MSRTPSAPTRRVVGWAAFVVVAGLLAMHGLATHGAMGPGDPMTSVSSTVSSPHGTHHPDSSDQHHHATPGMATCVAVLGLGLLLLALAMVLLRRTRRGWLAARATARGLLAGLRARAPDPPDLWTLSVCRC